MTVRREGDRFRMMVEPPYMRERVNLDFVLMTYVMSCGAERVKKERKTVGDQHALDV